MGGFAIPWFSRVTKSRAHSSIPLPYRGSNKEIAFLPSEHISTQNGMGRGGANHLPNMLIFKVLFDFKIQYGTHLSYHKAIQHIEFANVISPGGHLGYQLLTRTNVTL